MTEINKLPATSFVMLNKGFIKKVVIGENGKVDKTKEVIYRQYATGKKKTVKTGAVFTDVMTKIQTEEVIEIDEVQLCEVVYNDKLKSYVPKCLAAKTLNELQPGDLDVLSFNKEIIPPLPEKWKQEVEQSEKPKGVYSLDELPDEGLKNKIKNSPTELRYSDQCFIKVDDNTYISTNAFKSLVCYKKNDDYWQNVANNNNYNYSNIIAYNDGFTFAAPNIVDQTAPSQQIYIPEIKFADPYAEMYSQRILDGKKGCSFAMGTNLDTKVPDRDDQTILQDQDEQVLLAETEADFRKNGPNMGNEIGRIPLSIVTDKHINTDASSKKDENVRFDISENMDIDQVTIITQQHDVSKIYAQVQEDAFPESAIPDRKFYDVFQGLEAKHEKGRKELLGNLRKEREKNWEQIQPLGQGQSKEKKDLLRKLDDLCSDPNIDRKKLLQEHRELSFGQDLLYQCYENPNNIDILKLNLKKDSPRNIQVTMIGEKDFPQNLNGNSIDSLLTDYFRSLSEEEKKAFIKQAEELVKKEPEYYESKKKKDLAFAIQEGKKHNNHSLSPLFADTAIARNTDVKYDYFNPIAKNNGLINPLFRDDPQTYGEETSKLTATMYFISPIPHSIGVSDFCSMRLDCSVPDPRKILTNMQKEYAGEPNNNTITSEVSIAPINNNSKLILPHNIPNMSKATCGIIQNDNSIKDNIPMRPGDAVLHFEDDTIVVMQSIGNDNSTKDDDVHIKIFPNTNLQEVLKEAGINDFKYEDGDYIDIVMKPDTEPQQSYLLLRNANCKGFNENEGNYPRQFDLSDKSGLIIPKLKQYRLNSLCRAVPNYVSSDVDKVYQIEEASINTEHNIFSDKEFSKYDGEISTKEPTKLNKRKNMLFNPLKATEIAKDIIMDRKTDKNSYKLISAASSKDDIKKCALQLQSFDNAVIEPVWYKCLVNKTAMDEKLLKAKKDFKLLSGSIISLAKDIDQIRQIIENDSYGKTDIENTLKNLFLLTPEGKKIKRQCASLIDPEQLKDGIAKFKTEIGLDEIEKQINNLDKEKDSKKIEELKRTYNAKIIDYGLGLVKNNIDSAHKKLHEANINILHPSALRQHTDNECNPIIVGQQYLRLFNYANTLQRVDNRKEANIDSLGKNEAILKDDNKLEEYRKQAEELDTINKKHDGIFNEQAEWLEDKILQITQQPGLGNSTKLNAVHTCGALAQTATLVNQLLLDPKNKDKTLRELQEKVSGSPLFYGSSLAHNGQMDMDQYGSMTLEQLATHIETQKSTYQVPIAEEAVETPEVEEFVETPEEEEENIKVPPPPPKIITSMPPPPLNPIDNNNIEIPTMTETKKQVISSLVFDSETNLITQIRLDENGEKQEILLKPFTYKNTNGEETWIILEVHEETKGNEIYYMPNLENFNIDESAEETLKQGKLPDQLEIQIAENSRDLINTYTPNKITSYINKSNDKYENTILEHPCVKLDDNTFITIDNDGENKKLQCWKQNDHGMQNISSQMTSCNNVYLCEDGSMLATGKSVKVPSFQMYISESNLGTDNRPEICVNIKRGSGTNGENELFLIDDSDKSTPLDADQIATVKQEIEQYADFQPISDFINVPSKSEPPVDPPITPVDPPITPVDPPITPVDPPITPVDPPITPVGFKSYGTMYSIDGSAKCISSTPVLRKEDNDTDIVYGNPLSSTKVVDSDTYTVLNNRPDPDLFINNVSGSDNNKNPSYNVQARKSDGTFTPPLLLNPDDPLIKFDDDTIAMLKLPGQENDPTIIRIIPGKELNDTISAILQKLPEGSEIPGLADGLEEGDFIEIQIGDPSCIVVKNLKDANCMAPNDDDSVKRRINIGSIAQNVLADLNKKYNLQSLVEKHHSFGNEKPLDNSTKKFQPSPESNPSPSIKEKAESLSAQELNTNLQDSNPIEYSIKADDNPTLAQAISFQINNGPSQALSSCLHILDSESKHIQETGDQTPPLNNAESFGIKNMLSSSKDLEDAVELFSQLDDENFDKTVNDALLNISILAPTEKAFFLTEEELKRLSLPNDYYKLTKDGQKEASQKAIETISKLKDGDKLKTSLLQGIESSKIGGEGSQEKMLKNFRNMFKTAKDEHARNVSAEAIGLDAPLKLDEIKNDPNKKADLINKINNKFLDIGKNQNTMAKDKTSSILKLHNPLLWSHAKSGFDPLDIAYDYNAFTNAYVGLQQMEENSGIKTLPKEGEPSLKLQEIADKTKPLQEAATQGKNWLIANAMRAAQSDPSQGLDEKYLQVCGHNVQASLLVTKLSLGLKEGKKPENVTLGECIEDLKEDPIAQAYGLMNQDKELITEFKDLTLQEFQNHLEEQRIALTQESIDKCNKKQNVEVVTKEIIDAGGFAKCYDNAATKQTRNAYDNPVFATDKINREIMEVEREIDNLLKSSPTVEKEKTEKEEKLTELFQKIQELEKEKMYLSCANRLLSTRKTYIESGENDKKNELDQSIRDKQTPPITLEDACAVMAEKPAGNKPYIEVTFNPYIKREDGKQLLTCEINGVGGKSNATDPKLATTLQEEINKGTTYQMHMEVTDDRMDDFFLISRQEGLEKAVEKCGLNPDKFDICSTGKDGKTTTITLKQYQDICKDLKKDKDGKLQLPEGTDPTLFNLMLQANKDNVPNLGKIQQKSEGGGKFL